MTLITPTKKPQYIIWVCTNKLWTASIPVDAEKRDKIIGQLEMAGMEFRVVETPTVTLDDILE